MFEKIRKKRVIRDDEMFEKEMFRQIVAWSTGFELLTIIYCICIGNISLDKLPFALISGILLCIVLHFLFHLAACSLFTQSVSEDLAAFYSYETTEKERTKLLKRLTSIPKSIGIEVFVIYVLCSTGWVALLVKVANLDTEALIMMIGIMYLGSYYAAAWTMSDKAQKICSHHAANIIAKGISKAEVDKFHTFGTKSSVIASFFFFVPIFTMAVFIFLVAWRSYASYMTAKLAFTRLFIMTFVPLGSYCIYATLIFKRMMASINGMCKLLAGINRENFRDIQAEKTDLSNEFMYNVHLINTIIAILQKILKESQDISMAVIESSNELSVISRETAVTSLEQDSGVKELLSAMEETDNLSKNIADKINEVSIVAKKTTENIVDGFEILKQNMHKLDEIKAANDVTVEGIKKLTEKISGISEIARIINGIADQTNIIAFNAEIEASSAGEVGENFALVANEIRRLTNNTIQSTNEIRNRIIEIQHSSDALLLSSQNGCNKILDGNNIINELNKRFEELQHSSETMDYASEDIKKIIDQQTASFAQIVVTLRQISAASETFSSSTQKISDSAQNLCLISENLKDLQPKEAVEMSAAVTAESREVK